MKRAASLVLLIISLFILGGTAHAQTTTVIATFNFDGGNGGDPCVNFINHPLVASTPTTGLVGIGVTTGAGGTAPECYVSGSLTINLTTPASAVSLKHISPGVTFGTISLSLGGALVDTSSTPGGTYTRNLQFDRITITGGAPTHIDDIMITWELPADQIPAAIAPPWSPGDDRIAPHISATLNAYCEDYGLAIYTADGGELIVSNAQINAVGIPAVNTLIASGNGVWVYRLTDGLFQIMEAPVGGKQDVVIFELDGCTVVRWRRGHFYLARLQTHIYAQSGGWDTYPIDY